jgi:hypothetical protein
MNTTPKTRSIFLEDIRYFECEGLVDNGTYHHYTEKLYAVPKLAWVRANRLATFCYQAKVSITKRSLYICFTPALADGAVHPTDFRNEVWQRYVMYGLPLNFNEYNDEDKVKRIWSATLACLQAIAPPDQHKMIEAAAITVEAGGEDLQFLLGSAKTKHYLAELSYTIPTWPNMAYLLLTLTDRTSLVKSTCVLFESKLYDECSFLGGKIKIVDDNIIVSTKASSDGQYYAQKNNVSSFVVAINSLIKGEAVITTNPYQ